MGLLSYDRTNKQRDKQRLQLYVYIAWEPSAAQFAKSYPRQLPALIRF